MSIFVLPDLGEGLQEAELVAWHVAEGDHVVADQPLVSVETEKAVVEVPSPQSGRIARLRAQPGERVKVGAALVEFDEGPRADTGTVVGELAAATAPAARAADAAPAGAAAVRATPAVRALAHRPGRAARRRAPGDGRQHDPLACRDRPGDGVRRGRHRGLGAG